jgi:hypothetical protein
MFTTCKGEDDQPTVTDLWEQIRNTSWIKEGDLHHGIGFYSPYKGPMPYINSSPYWVFVEVGYHYFYLTTWNYIEINRYGNKIENSFDISVSGDSLILSESNSDDSNSGSSKPESDSGGSNSVSIYGTYYKISSDPYFDWSSYWN